MNGIDFPPENHTFKIMGLADDGFKSFVLGHFATTAPQLQITACKEVFSKNQKYLSLSITAQEPNLADLNAIYASLSKHPRVLYML